jgi:hypothetical protein
MVAVQGSVCGVPRCYIPGTKCPLAIFPLTEPSHLLIQILLSEATPDFQLLCTLVLRSGGVLCKAGQTPHLSIMCRRLTEAAKAADRASSTFDVVQGRNTSVRGTISKGHFVQGVQHPRIFGHGHIGWGHINPASICESLLLQLFFTFPVHTAINKH